jgi:hypothetical protein
VVSGSQANQPVPSHPSHMQSVQASVAAQWSSGRTEMWPLQILDFADKQRAASRLTTSTAQRPTDATTLNVSSSGSNRRQPTSSGSSALSHRSPSSHTSAARDRTASFPPVPVRPTKPPGSPQRSPPLMSAPSAEAYAPPQNIVPPKSDEKEKPSQGAPSG